MALGDGAIEVDDGGGVSPSVSLFLENRPEIAAPRPRGNTAAS
jgi:hypothetical protein